jgi:NADH dehydrogenase
MGVEVLTNARVVDVGPDGVKLEHGTISSGTVLWAAGADASPLGRTLGVPVNASGRVPVEPDLSLAGHPEVSVIGDLAFVADANGRPLAAVAPVAIQEGRAVADNIWRSILGRPPRAFRYRDRGVTATIGRAAAVGRIGPFHIVGSPAWLAWLLVHIVSLVGFRNRLQVLLGWMWSYLAWQRGVRIITRRWRPMIGQDGLVEAGRIGGTGMS